ncbi:MAG: hypothetical protein E6F99_30535 [Actinobacteria bacterium]|nr:MAG: hypothetical protein E6F99_30535 [Actinomycetota bacterium]
MVATTLRQRPVQRQVAQLLAADSQLLTSGQAEGPRSIERLIRALQAHGATQVQLPRCGRCGHIRRLPGRDGDQRICAQCTARDRARPCALCGNTRRVAHLDRHGRPRCAYCPPEDGNPIDTIATVIDALGLGLTRDTVAQAVSRAAPRPFQQRRLAWVLQDNPTLLMAVVDLIEALIADGANLARPPCPFCGKAIRLGYRRDGVRCCRGCRAAAHTGICSRCEEHKKITARTLDGLPLCHGCMRQDPIDHEPCSRCGQTRQVITRRDGQPLCQTCHRRPVAVCSICGKTRPCYRVSTSTPRCEPCTRRLGSRPDCARCGKPRLVRARTADGQPLCDSCARPPEPCLTCGRSRYVQGRTVDGAPLCRTCYPKHPVARRPCTGCGLTRQIHHHGLCDACARTEQLRVLLSDAQGVMRHDVEPVFGRHGPC